MERTATILRGLLALAALALAGPSGVFATPISLTVIGDDYTQNFDGLAKNGTGNTQLPAGWAMSAAGYAAGNGSATDGGMYSYGTTGSSERALGSLSNGTGTLSYGAQFVNKTGRIITDLDIQYYGEQWRRSGSNTADTLYFRYSLDASSLATGTWLTVTDLNFVSPSSSGVASALNANLSTYRRPIQYMISGLSIADNATFWIGFFDPDIPGKLDQGLAVDDFQLTPLSSIPVPEPSTVVLLGSGLLAMSRRRVTSHRRTS